MPTNRPQHSEPALPWRAPVKLEDIGETGAHFDLTADADIRAGVARMAGLRDLPRLEAAFDVTRYGSDGLRVVGVVSATVGQTCVVSLEPLTNEVEEEIDLVFAPQPVATPKAASDAADTTAENARREEIWAKPEPLVGGAVDLGALATEFLFLGLDPYPRKPGAVFDPLQDLRVDEGPFAVLAQLTKARDGR